MPPPPVLSKSKDEVGCGRLRVNEGVVLESRTEVIFVIKDLGANPLIERLGHVCWRIGTVDHSAAQRGDVDITIRCLNEYTTLHGIEDITST